MSATKEKSANKNYFNYDKLVECFIQICPDFCEQKTLSAQSVSQRFAEKVIFEYSKAVKAAKTRKCDESWEIRLETTNRNGLFMVNKVIISTYFTKPPPEQQPCLLHDNLQLTFKQASLLAVDKYCQLVPLLVSCKQIVLTPLAGAVFTREIIPDIATALSNHLGKHVSVSDVIIGIICSCQTDGYWLKKSSCDIAIVALNKTIANLDQRAALIKKTLKMYKLHGKEFNMDLFKIYDRYSIGGAGAKPRKLSEKVETQHLKPIDDDEINGLVALILQATVDKEAKMSQVKRETISCLDVYGTVSPLKKKSSKCAANIFGGSDIYKNCSDDKSNIDNANYDDSDSDS